MSTAGIIASVVILVSGIAWVLMPLLLRRTSQQHEQLNAQKSRDELVTTYERVLAVIRDLDEDFSTGKLTQDVYQREREIWSERGVEVLHLLEKQGLKAAPQPKPAAQAEHSADQVLDDAIERAISDYRTAVESH